MTYTIPEFGPSDLLTSQTIGVRRIKVSSEDPNTTALLEGQNQIATFSLIIPADTHYSVKPRFNTTCILKYTKCPGVLISYYKGQENGDLIELDEGRSLNFSSVSDYQFGIEVYDEAPSGDEIILDSDVITLSVVPGDVTVIGLNNTTDEAIEINTSVYIEFTGVPDADFMLSPDAELIETTEMGNFNG